MSDYDLLKLRLESLEARVAAMEQGQHHQTSVSPALSPHILKILRTVADAFDLTVAQMLRPGRQQRFCFPRQVAMYVIRETTKLSSTEIGECFTPRKFDHGTVLYGCRAVLGKTMTDAKFKAELQRILADCSRSPNGTSTGFSQTSLAGQTEGSEKPCPKRRPGIG